MLTKEDLSKIRDLLRVEVLPRLDRIEARLGAAEQKIDALSRGLSSLEFRAADLKDDIESLSLATGRGFARLEHRLDAAGIPESPEFGDGAGPWLPPFRPSST